MKLFKKIILPTLVLAVLSVMTVLAFAGAYEGTVSGLGEMTAQIGETSDKLAAVKAAEEYALTVDPEADGAAAALEALADAELALLDGYLAGGEGFDGKYTAITEYGTLYAVCNTAVKADAFAASLASAEQLAKEAAQLGLDGFDLEGEGVALSKVRINKVKRILSLVVVDDAALTGELAEKDALQVAASLKAKEMTESYVDFSEYEYLTEKKTGFGSGELIPGHGNAGSDGRNFADRDSGMDGDNYYYSIKYFEKEAVGAVTTLNTYGSISLNDTTQGMVFEMKITTFGQLPKEGIFFNSGEDNTLASGRVFPRIGKITGKGQIGGSDKDPLYLDGASIIVPGQWISIAFVYNPVNYTVKVYVENEYVGSHSCAISNAAYKLTSLRLGGSSTSGEFSVDDLCFYKGSDIRTTDKFETMNEDELFTFYVGFMINEDLPVLSRALAAQRAGDLLGKYWDSATNSYITLDATLKSAVDSYLTFDTTVIYEEAKANNLVKYLELVAALTAIGRTPDNVNERNLAIKSVDQFMASIGDLILKNEDFVLAQDKVATARAAVDADTNAVTFIDAMTKFKTASTYNAKKKHFESAATAFDLGVDISVNDDPAFVALKEAYELYLVAEEELGALLKAENSKRVIDCVNFLKTFGTDLDVWEENAETMDMYVTVVRKIVNSGDYNPEYEGIDEALRIYEVVGAYFYDKLQQRHAAFLNEKLTECANAQNYIDKLGIVSYIGRYLDDNDIDPTHELIAEVLATYEGYKAELEADEPQYEAYLAANSERFVQAVQRMLAATNYSERKAAYLEAEGYYGVMNIGTAEVVAVLPYFDAAELEFRLIEEASADFIDAVALLAIANKSGIFSCLVDAAAYVESIDLGIEGVTEAKATYDAIYADYCRELNAVNEEVSSTVACAGGMRTVAVEGAVSAKVTAGTLSDKD